ncbi:flavodoxin family protein [Anaeroarcus burkinensis]|uniref:flavodoxin family protein n=1 Tax=Anaeroarcus burkinensis TaxID=82376 RepID=UPI0003FD4DFB|nr:flavodoxin family protein [Anaeroarcus burkinensis]
MGKNILVLTGSPRKGGNSEKLADAFIAGAQEVGHTVMKYATADKTIKGCIDCKRCFKKGAACSISDDFNELAPHLAAADMLVLATPLYWFSFPTQLKATLDKMYSFLIAEKPLAIKECVLLVTGGDKEEKVFEGIVRSYQLMLEFMGWQDRGVIVVPGMHDKDEILKTDALERAKTLGESL